MFRPYGHTHGKGEAVRSKYIPSRPSVGDAADPAGIRGQVLANIVRSDVFAAHCLLHFMQPEQQSEPVSLHTMLSLPCKLLGRQHTAWESEFKVCFRAESSGIPARMAGSDAYEGSRESTGVLRCSTLIQFPVVLLECTCCRWDAC